jgi:hypothetical protein
MTLLNQNNTETSYSFELPGGRLEVKVTGTEKPFEDLCAVASRLNAQRPFVFVSKVLGKHWPAKPETLTETHRLLAEKIGRLEPPVIFMAMAETAIGLGRGVFEQWYSITGEENSLFCHTTRYNLEKPLAFRIDESHSHARDHLIYEPDGDEKKAVFSQAKSLVLVDDEISTGRTLSSLAQAYAQKNPFLSSLTFVCLTNWLPYDQRLAINEQTAGSAGEVRYVSLLNGSFNFIGSGQLETNPGLRSVGNWQPMGQALAVNYGRLGLTPSESMALSRKAMKAAETLKINSGPVRVIGTGEFLHEPYVVARHLEELGYEVKLQSTTRTPLTVGQAIENSVHLSDNYGEGIDNFLYNASRNFSGQTFALYETGQELETLSHLGAQTIKL